MTGLVTGNIEPESSPWDHPVRSAVGVTLAILSAVVISLEFTMVFPAVTELASAFHTTDIAWSLSILTLVAAAVSPLGGKLGDRFGKKRTMLGIMLCTTAGSLLCALTPTYALFLAGRGLQGTGAVLMPLALGYIRDVLPPRFIAVGLGANVTGIGAAAVAGPFLSAWLLRAWGYQGIFWFLLLYMTVVALMFAVIAPDTPVRQRRRLDLVSAILLGVGAGVLLLGVSEGSTWGWGSAPTVTSFVAGVMLVGAAVARMLTIAEPLLNMRDLAGPKLRTTVLFVFFGNVPIVGAAFLLPLMVQTRSQPGINYGMGASPLEFAVMILPYGIVVAALGPLAGLLARIRNPRGVARFGAVIMLATTLMLGFWHSQEWQIITIYTAFGAGFSCFYAAFPNLVAQAVPPEEMATTSALMNVVNGMAGSVTLTLVGMVIGQNILNIDPVTGSPVVTDSGYAIAWLLLAAGALAALIITVVMTHGKAPATGKDEEWSRGIGEPTAAV